VPTYNAGGKKLTPVNDEVGWLNFITPVGGLFATIFYYSTAAEDY